MPRTKTRTGGVEADGSDRNIDVALRGHSPEHTSDGIFQDRVDEVQAATSALNGVERDPGLSTVTALEPAIGRAEDSHRETELTHVRVCLAEIETIIRCACQSNVTLEVRVGSDVPALECCPLGLQGAILNLVSNALDAMPDRGLILIDATAVVRGPAAYVELRIEDNGIGMTQQTIDCAFDPFFTTKGRGLGGAGLPMVKHFAEQHGGTVDMDSTPGSGTIVILRLPAAPGDSK